MKTDKLTTEDKKVLGKTLLVLLLITLMYTCIVSFGDPSEYSVNVNGSLIGMGWGIWTSALLMLKGII